MGFTLFPRKGNRHFMLVPYIPGFWDFQVKRMDKDVAEAFEAYYVPQAREMFSSATPPVRVVTLEKQISSTL